MSTYRPYPKTKPSGVEWLGDVPVGWEVSKPKFTAPFQVGWTPPTGNDANFEGDNLWANISDLKERVITDTAKRISDEAAARASMSITPKGALLYSFKLSVGSVAFAGTDLYTNEAIASFLPNRYTHLSFLYYAFQISIIENAAENIYGAKILNQELIRSTPLLCPPLPEQIQIAAFLDRECGKLDALQAKQERLIELLKEKRQALISHTVTKGLPAEAAAKAGLDPDLPGVASAKTGAKLKPSGIEWLGDVPVHWRVVPLDYDFTIQLGKMLDSNRITGKHLRPYLRVFDVQWGKINSEDLPQMDFDEEAREKFRLQIGDLLVNEGGSYPGRSAVWMGDIDECYYQKALHRIRPRRPERSCTAFLYYLMYWATGYGVFSAGGNEATIEHLPAEKLRKYRFPLPPLAEQRAIVAHLDDKCGRMDALIAKAERAIALLKERRSALISAAVTGKIDVRDV